MSSTDCVSHLSDEERGLRVLGGLGMVVASLGCGIILSPVRRSEATYRTLGPRFLDRDLYLEAHGRVGRCAS